ncbi:hypothetical protein MSZK_11760 [Mycobacterium sp. shizuoka-1]|nr:hypothetical protein MSZK_11760 [Mycobacterium sp. shizuoka-1]
MSGVRTVEAVAPASLGLLVFAEQAVPASNNVAIARGAIPDLIFMRPSLSSPDFGCVT